MSQKLRRNVPTFSTIRYLAHKLIFFIFTAQKAFFSDGIHRGSYFSAAKFGHGQNWAPKQNWNNWCQTVQSAKWRSQISIAPRKSPKFMWKSTIQMKIRRNENSAKCPKILFGEMAFGEKSRYELGLGPKWRIPKWQTNFMTKMANYFFAILVIKFT